MAVVAIVRDSRVLIDDARVMRRLTEQIV